LGTNNNQKVYMLYDQYKKKKQERFKLDWHKNEHFAWYWDGIETSFWGL
jgi:hypothetical protein